MKPTEAQVNIGITGPPAAFVKCHLSKKTCLELATFHNTFPVLRTHQGRIFRFLKLVRLMIFELNYSKSYGILFILIIGILFVAGRKKYCIILRHVKLKIFMFNNKYNTLKIKYSFQ